MKRLLVISLVLLSCQPKLKKESTPVILPKELKGVYHENNGQLTQDANVADYSSYQGKIIKEIKYCDGCGRSGDLIIITFTDNSQLKIYAYKYNMHIYY